MSLRTSWLLVLLCACGTGQPDQPPPPVETMDPGALADLRVFFGHQSVGRDILAGMGVIAPDLSITAAAASSDGPGILEASIGANEHPSTKDHAFFDILATLDPLDAALYKYCYIDVGPGTDVVDLFERYERTLARAPVPTIPITLPLTTIEPGWKRWMKQLAGRPTQSSLNAKRAEFNEMVRTRYEQGAIIDLARLESTRENGTRCVMQVEGKDVEYLAPEFTDDGSHLNERGRIWVARGFLEALKSAIEAQ